MWKNTRNAFLKRVRFVILASKGIISIVVRVRELPSALTETDKICVYSSFKMRKPPEMLSIKRERWESAGRNRKDVCILRSKRGKPPEMLSVKRARLIILARKGISIVAKVH